MKHLRRLMCLLLCMALLPLAWTVRARAEESAPNVRIYLKRLNLTDRADLQLDGIYTLSSGGKTVMAFPQGCEITLQVRQGEIYLFYQGLSVNVGAAVQLVQNQGATGGRQGLRGGPAAGIRPAQRLTNIILHLRQKCSTTISAICGCGGAAARKGKAAGKPAGPQGRRWHRWGWKAKTRR